MTLEAIAAAAASVIAFLVTYLTIPPLIRLLEARGQTVPDVHKKGKIMVAHPAGPSLIAGILASEAVLYWLLPDTAILAVMATTALAFLVGFADDRKARGGWFKPVALAFAAAPMLLLGAYDSDLAFPLFGEVHIPVLYLGIAVLMIVITGNTINSIDVVNSAASGFMVIAGSALSASLFLAEWLSGSQDYGVALASLPLIFVSLALYRYHRLPSRIFPGDSGVLTLGCMYGALAIAGGMEVVAAVALLPAIINSFLFLSSTKRIVEYRKIKARGVALTEDKRIMDTGNRDAPVTLVRLLVRGGSMTEGEVARTILKLALFAGGLAVITALMVVWA